MVLHVCFGVVCFGWASIEKVEAVLFLFCCLYSAVKRNSIPSAARSTTICLTCLTSALHACPFLSMKTGYPNNARLNHRLNRNIIGRLSFPFSSFFLSFSPIFSFQVGDLLLLAGFASNNNNKQQQASKQNLSYWEVLGGRIWGGGISTACQRCVLRA